VEWVDVFTTAEIKNINLGGRIINQRNVIVPGLAYKN
jgi:hypothetical protein